MTASIMIPLSHIVAQESSAKEVIAQLERMGVRIQGRTVLDVGFGLGFNAAAMSTLGAKVIGIEPDTSKWAWAIQEGKIKQDDACGRLQDMSKDFVNQVDVAVVLLWNIDRSEYDDVLGTLSQKISPQGLVIIGIHDQVYISDPYGVAVKPHAKQYFGNVQEKTFPDMLNKYFLICTNPKLL